MTPIFYPNGQSMLTTRDAHEALAVLKKLVDNAEEKIRRGMGSEAEAVESEA